MIKVGNQVREGNRNSGGKSDRKSGSPKKKLDR